MERPFLFTDRRAYLAAKAVFNSYDNLNQLRWDIIKDNTWHKEYSSLRKELKQAEFLIHKHLPTVGILGIVTHNPEIATFVQDKIKGLQPHLQVIVKPEYYYL